MSDDCISRQVAIDVFKNAIGDKYPFICEPILITLSLIPSVTPQPKTGHCKDCKYFEYNSVAKVDGVPLIVAHEICNKWGDGCKTKADGYCFMFEPQERSDKCSKCKYHINPDYTRCKECGAESEEE